jgi:hypothetical protein
VFCRKRCGGGGGGGGGVVVAVYNTWLATSGWVCGWQQYTSHETKYPPVKTAAAYLRKTVTRHVG